MSLTIYRKRIKIVHHHIRTKTPGNIERLAQKLNLSRAAAYKFLGELKEEGFPIAYSKKDNRFYYEKSGEMIGYVFVEDKPDENKNIGGGGVKKLF